MAWWIKPPPAMLVSYVGTSLCLCCSVSNFHSRFRLPATGLSAWVTTTHVGDLGAAPGSTLAEGSEPLEKRLSPPPHFLCNSFYIDT